MLCTMGYITFNIDKESLYTKHHTIPLLLQQAFLEGRFYPGYVWITPGWYQQGWWKADEDYLHSLNCTTSDIEQHLDRALVLLAHPNMVSCNSREKRSVSFIALRLYPTELCQHH